MFQVERAPQELSFGRQGESNILSYAFDFSEWAEDWPGGEATISVTLPNETEACGLLENQAVVEGNVITLHVWDNLTKDYGRGTVVIRYEAGINKKRSRLIEFTVDKGHDTQVGNAPSLIEDWMTHHKLLYDSHKLLYDITNTKQTMTLNEAGDVTQIVHTDLLTDEIVRTDVFTYDGDLKTEVRTLAGGRTITIVTDRDALERTITEG